MALLLLHRAFILTETEFRISDTDITFKKIFSKEYFPIYCKQSVKTISEYEFSAERIVDIFLSDLPA